MAEKNKFSSEQIDFWRGKFGEVYLERNKTFDEVNKRYKNQTGITVEQIFLNFFEDIDRDLKIIELGCNVGLNLSFLQKMGFRNLYGLELNQKACEIAARNNPSISFIHSGIEEYDPKDEKFDLVFTAGVLIHINPNSLNSIIKKIVNLSNKYIFGFEYFSNDVVAIDYRNHKGVMWKQNFPLLYKKLFPSLKTIKEEKIPYKEGNLYDVAYLLMKT